MSLSWGGFPVTNFVSETVSDFYLGRAARSLSFSASMSSSPLMSFPVGSIRMTVPNPERPNHSSIPEAKRHPHQGAL